MARSATTSRQAWIQAAFGRFHEDGLCAIRVERIAQDVNATKGSFYWHFKTRRDLIDAVVEQWEREATEDLIKAADASGDSAHTRIAALFSSVRARDPFTIKGEATLYRDAPIEGVTEAVNRVTHRRISYLADLISATGVKKEEAVNRSRIALAAVIGLHQLAFLSESTSPKTYSKSLVETALSMTLCPPNDSLPAIE